MGTETSRPRRFKIYAPDGKNRVVVGWIHMGYAPPPNEDCTLMMSALGDKESSELNRLCVIVNEETNEIVYNPRRPPIAPPWAAVEVLKGEHKEWLGKNPAWPAQLELDFDKVDPEMWRWED